MTNENRPEIDIYAAMDEGRRLRALAFRDACLSLTAFAKRVFGAATDRASSGRASEV